MPALTSGEPTLLRTHPHKVKEYLAVLHPGTVLACQLNGAPSSDPVTQIDYDNVTEGSYTDVVPGMTLWVGTAAGKRDKGTCRIRKAPTSSILYIAEDSKIDWADDDHLTVVENYEFWVKYPRVVTNGSITVYKDWEIAYSDQHSNWEPVAILGPPDCQFIDPGSGVATCKFVGEHSYPGAPGASISTYSWSFPGGTPSSSSSPGTEASPVEVTWDTPGIYWISLTVTDSNGKTHTGRRPVFIFERTGSDVPYTRFKMTGRSGSLNQHGHTASFEVHGDADQAEFPDGALVVYFTEDWYGSTKQSIGGNFKYREHIKFAGYVQRESTTKDPQTSVVTFDAATVNALMATREGFSCWIKNKGSASTWTEATNLTADRAALSLCRYHSTILDIADVIPSGSTLKIKSQEFAAKTAFLQQLQTLYTDLCAHVACDKQGRLYFELDPQMRPVADRSGIAIVADLQHGDWRERIDLPRPQEPKTSFINLAGVYYPGHPSPVQPILSKAPGDAPAYGGSTREISGLILAGQSDGNAKAGLALAYDNNEFPDVPIPMAGNWDVFDVVPQEYVRLSLTASDTKRGIVWTNQKLIVRGVDLRLEETEGGRVAMVDIRVEKDSYGPSGVDGDYPDDVPDWSPTITPPAPVPPDPPGGAEGDGSLLYFTDYASGHLFRTRNARNPTPGSVVYEDLGYVCEKPAYIALDSWDPKNCAMIAGRNGVWRTENLNDTIPTWTRVLDLTNDAEDDACMVVSSICQQGLWMVGARIVKNEVGVNWYPYVYVTETDGESWTEKRISNWGQNCGWVKVEASSHSANRAWAMWNRGDGSLRVAKTTDKWSSYSDNACPNMWAPGAGGYYCYHRFYQNDSDLIALWGATNSGTARVSFCTGDLGSCTYADLDAGSSADTPWVGGYTWGTHRYWALTYGIVASVWTYRFHISDDGEIWTLQHSFSAPTRFISGWPYELERFYATQDGTTAPILISDDRGQTWTAQTGNWGSLGYSGQIYCCVPVWVA